jgi:hypothetical protein
MKKIAMFLLIAVFCIPALAVAAPTPADFSYCSEVQAVIKADSLYQIHLTDDIIQKASAGLLDLRLFDSSGKETPFTVIENVPPYEETVETYPMEITGYDAGASSTVITMKLPQKHRPISLLDLDIADRDFKKHVTLSGSSDGKTWQMLVEDSVYDFTSQVNLRKTRIDFPKSEARFFRLTLTDFAPQQATQQSIKLKYEGLEFSVNEAQKKELHIHAVKGSTLIPAEKKPVYDQKSFTNLAPEPNKDGNTVIAIAAALPIDQLSIDVTNHYYYRIINLYGSTTGRDDSYRFLASQPIYRFPLSSEQHEEKNHIESNLPKYAYYKVIVMNKNNPPLDMRGITVSWIQQNLYFIALRNDERYSLCFGNQRMTRPDYDIVKFVNRNSLSRHSFEHATLAAPVQSGGPSLTLRERLVGMEKLVLKVVVVLLVVGMGGWLYTLLKKAQEKK